MINIDEKWYKNGKLKERLTGDFEENWFKNGQLSNQGKFGGGQIVKGVHKSWKENGLLVYHQEFDEDGNEKTILHKEWDDNGLLIYHVELDKDGNEVEIIKDGYTTN